MFAAIYWLFEKLSTVLQLSPSYHAELLIAAPKLLQAFIAAAGDYYTWRLAERIYGKRSQQSWAAVCSPHICLDQVLLLRHY